MSLRHADDHDNRDADVESDDREGAQSGPASRLDLAIDISHAGSIRSTEWQPASGPWSDLVHILMDHQEQDAKDGLCFVPGLLRGKERKNAEVELLALLVFDLDRGEKLASIRQKLIASGLEALIYSTYSHLSTRSTIAAASYRTFTGQTAVEPHLVLRYLAEVKRIQPHVLAELRVLSDSSGEDEVIQVEHCPIEKYRVVIPLAQPFAVGELMRKGMALPTIKSLWKTAYCAVGDLLGLDFDGSCARLLLPFACAWRRV